jgi:hypothetical protein
MEGTQRRVSEAVGQGVVHEETNREKPDLDARDLRGARCYLDVRSSHKGGRVKLMANKILAVNVLLALGVCTFSVTLAVLLAPILSSEAVLDWLTTTPPCGSTDSAVSISLFI